MTFASRYWHLTLVAPDHSVGSLIGALRELGALGVHEQQIDAARVSVSAFFDSGLDRAELADRIRARLAKLVAGGATLPRTRLAALVSDDRAEAWPEYFVPVSIGRRLLVVPAWFDVPATSRVAIVIDPGRGFGTGHHASTAGCLKALEVIVERDRPGDAVDLGTGSGILAITAARLGVPRVVAVDSDPDAVGCATANARINGVSPAVRFISGDAARVELEPAPLVVANLLAPVHTTLAERYRGLVVPGGALVLGGMLDTETDAVAATLERNGFASAARFTVAGWTTLALARR